MSLSELQAARSTRAPAPHAVLRPRARCQPAAAVALLVLLVLAEVLAGCQSCGRKKLRRFGATCGRNSECAGGVCFQGRCTNSCKGDAECGGGVCIENVCHEPDTDLDGDGLGNALELKLKLDPANPDTDGDGLADGVELGPNPNAPLDSNGDGTIDALQSNTADGDGDCMVDALDVAPHDKSKHNLPTAAELCNRGVCAQALGAVKVVCRKEAPLQKGVVKGCTGCGCEADTGVLPNWEASESLCDELDNDCDGLVDEEQVWLGLPLGATCQHAEGLCAAYDTQGKAIKGVVECTTQKKAGCSVGPGGSNSLAKPEGCNYLDDDCDGQTDEDFQLEGKKVGAACAGCGDTVFTCPDGSPANPAVISCNLEGDGALCNALPFAAGFERLSEGLPAPRARWTATWSPAWQKLLLYGGQVPTAHGVVVHDELWSLDAAAGPSNWTVAPAQTPGRRHKAALVWDAVGDRTLLLGGSVDGEPALTVWALGNNGKWSPVSALGTPDAVRVPPLPFALGGRWLRGVILTAGNVRHLVLFVEGLKPLWHVELGLPDGDWKPLSTDGAAIAGIEPLSGTVRCAATGAPDSNWALAVTSSTGSNQPAVYRLRLSAAGGLSLDRLEGAPPKRVHDTCVIDDQSVLHVFGGQEVTGTTAPAWHSASFAGLPNEASEITWQSQPLGNDLAEVLDRSDPLAVWDAKHARIVTAGGHRRVGAPGDWHREGRADAWTWKPKTGVTAPLARPAPAARIGQASGRAGTLGFCLAGGLILDLPDIDGDPARARPARDAWCAGPNGQWSKRADGLPPYAFGIGGVDHVDEVLFMAAGYAIPEGGAAAEVWRLWETGLTFDEVNPLPSQPQVTSAIYRLDLKTGAMSSVSGKGPTLAASAVIHDPVRRRLISFGGFDNDKATRELWVLDLASSTFKQRGDGSGPMKAQYGSLLLYDAPGDVLAIAGGTHQNVNPDGKDAISLQIMDGGSTTHLGACYGQADAPMWMTRVDGPHIFGLKTLPTWGDPEADKPQKKLFRTQFGQPAFLPVLFDPIGRRGWVTLPDVVPPAATDEDGKPCEGTTKTPWTAASIQVRVAMGICGTQPEFFLEPGVFAPAPPSMFLSSATYDHTTRRAWVWGGLMADGRSSGALWRIEQTCKDSAP